MNLKRDTYAIVDLDHLKYNVELAHSEFKRPLMAVIKADAYGHGYKEVASFLKDILKCLLLQHFKKQLS